jgi:hypothetical protein
MAPVCARMTAVTAMAPAMPSRAPAVVPARAIRIDSAKNCAATSLRRAPDALRTPISRVRSATEASSTFMMPMPPTTSEMAAKAPIRILNSVMP